LKAVAAFEYKNKHEKMCTAENGLTDQLSTE